MKIAVVTLFPEMFKAISESGITRRAISDSLIQLEFFNPRSFAEDKHQTVDDRPYGGGPGMVMMAEPLFAAIASAKSWAKKYINVESEDSEANCRVIYLSPQGKTLNQQDVGVLANKSDNLVLVAGRYEGIDERVISSLVDEEISIGDYVLSGGELPAMVLIDAITRTLPGALGDSQSAIDDSFVNGLLDWPHFTRPEEFAGQCVPEVLTSGNHKAIAKWRLKQALGKTWQVKRDLIESREMTIEEEQLLSEFLSEQSEK